MLDNGDFCLLSNEALSAFVATSPNTTFVPSQQATRLRSDCLASPPEPTDGALRVVPIYNEAELHRFASSWDRLAERVPFRSWAWNECWWRHYRGPHNRLNVLALEDRDGNIRGLAPWYIDHSPWLGRVVRLLGTGEVCSEHLTILCAPGWQSSVVNTLADWLTQDDHPNWDTLELDGVDSDNVAVHALVAALAERRHRTHFQRTINAWRVNLPKSWDEYLALVSKRQRERLKRAFRRKFEAGQAQLCVADDLASLGVGWSVFESLHKRRRKSQGQAGSFASPRFAAFHREMARRLLASDQLRLQWLALKGCPAAAEYGLCDEQTAYCYQTGFEPQLSDESPGWLSFAASIHRAIGQGYRWFDFLRGDEAYKVKWLAEPRQLSTVRVFARHWRGSAQHAAWSLRQWIRKSWRHRRSL